MIRISDILDKIIIYDPDAELDIVERAYIYSARVHDGQVRLSGEPYLSHPLEVASILADMRLDVVSIAAGLLHDVVEDTHATVEEIQEMFGDEAAHIVSGVTKISKLPFHSSEARQAESIRKMILAMADDIRVILIKLADRVHNMRTLKFHKKPEKQARISQETLDIYAPISARLGIYWIKNELEDISFRYTQPEEYAYIESLVSKDKGERQNYIQKVRGLIRLKLDEANLKGDILGRYKQFYSIYQKMKKQGLEFKDVYDIIAFRVILDTVPQCYEVLGLIHSLWKPIPYKFKDYIGVPKPNMYQSLHTTVIGPFGERMEIQIRTKEMDKVAKAGIAAHWSYKEGKSVDSVTGNAYAWIQNLVENQENFREPGEFLENVRIDLFPDEVLVFTPNGDIKSLPKGATPVDFAYSIHSEVGDQCTGAKINGRMIPLAHELKTGDIVEVTTTKGHHPSKDWLKFVKTVKARSKVRQWIKAQEKERSLTLGREMCEKVFRKHKMSFNTALKSPEIDKVVAAFGLKDVDELIISVGYGKITPMQILRKVEPKVDSPHSEKSLLNKLMKRSRKKKTGEGIVVRGVDDILVRFAKCCHPVPGDDIVGYITQGHGVTVHIATCVNAVNMNQERKIEVEWNDDITETYPVKIRVRSIDRFGLLADLAANISKIGANILNANTENIENNLVDSFFTIAVDNKGQLNRIISSLKKVKQVQAVNRIDS